MPQTLKIVASDMDGTLLDVHHSLTPYTMETLYQLSKKDIPFVFATGRHYFSVKKAYKDLHDYFNKRSLEDQLQTTNHGFYLISSNGARVHSPSGELIIEHNIDPDIVQILYNNFGLPHTRQVYAGPGVSPVAPNTPVKPNDDGDFLIEKVSTSAYTTDEWYATATFLPIEEMEKKFGVRPFIVPFDRHDINNKDRNIFDEFPLNGVGKVCFRSSDRPLLDEFEKQFHALFGDRATICFSSNYCLDVMAKGVSKASAIQEVCNVLNEKMNLTDPNERLTLANVVSFGDSMNDCEMLQSVGKGFVMSNAQERLKDALPKNEVIGHHNDNSVAKKLRKVFNIPE